MALAASQVSAPGKLMILGEHAVLHGARAIVVAVDQRLHASLRPRADRTITITSDLGYHQTPLDTLADAPHCRFVIAALRHCRELLPGGLDLTIRADFTSVVGLGSSAAVTAATLGACHAARGFPLDPAAIFPLGLAAIHAVQGSGSGADLAASLYGGVLLYRHEPRQIERLADTLPLTATYSGSKVKTPQIIARVENQRQQHPAIFRHLYAAMDASSDDAAAAIRAGDWPRLGRIIDLNAALMSAIGVSTPPLEQRLQHLRDTPGIHGAKLSGAGLGDSLIGIGTGQPPPAAGRPLHLHCSPHGLRSESP